MNANWYLRGLQSVVALLFALPMVGREPARKLPAMGVGVSAATTGLGANVYWNPTSQWKVMGSYDIMTFERDFNFSTEGLDIDADLRYSMNGVFAKGGYQILSWLYATAGVGWLGFRPEIKGVPADDYKYGDIYLKPEVLGELNVKVKSGSTVSPYLGIGFGKQSAFFKRVAAGFELGAYYMGAPKLEVDATKMLAPTADPDHVVRIENQFSKYRIYPQVQVTISVKLF